MNTFELLKQLTDADGVSGVEIDAAETSANFLKQYCDEVSIDPRGSVTGILRSANPKKGMLHLDAHIDQVGFVITYITEDGFLKFDSCGGIDARILPGREVRILTEEPIYGVITSVPPHLQTGEPKAPTCSDLAIDTGMTKDELEKIVGLGTRAVFLSPAEHLVNNQVTMRALDDRSGVCSLILAAEILADKKPEDRVRDVLFTFSVQEEVGGRGAATSSFNYPVETSIAVDVSFAKTPGCSDEETGKIGEGPMIGFSPLHSRNLSKALCSTCEDNGIPFQREIMNGRTGTHADELAIKKGGTVSGLVSIPLKYMHTPAEIVDLEDVENTGRLLAAFAMEERSMRNV